MKRWDRTTTRRSALATVGTASIVGLAGCPGSGNDGRQTGDDQRTTVDRPTPEQQLPTPTLGDPDAPITVAAYEDLGCSHCRRYTRETQPELVSEYVEPGDVRYEWHDFPVPVVEPHSWLAADAARSVQANADSIDAFWSFTEQVYEHQDELSLDLYERLADDVGVDGAVVRQETEQRTYEPTVVASRQRGRERNVDGTPTVFVEDDRLEGPSFPVIRNAIEDARAGTQSPERDA